MKRIDIDNLNNLTTQLLDELKILPQIYENNEEPSKDKTFFQYVRNETKVLFDMLDEWEKLAEDFVLQRSSGVHLHQIQATRIICKLLFCIVITKMCEKEDIWKFINLANLFFNKY